MGERGLSLAHFSEQEIIRELSRRKKAREREEVEPEWCDECSWFRAWSADMRPPEDYNACEHGHAMKLKVPEGYTDNGGFYRRGCADRSPTTPAPAKEGE
jgi:hypothetical protein